MPSVMKIKMGINIRRIKMVSLVNHRISVRGRPLIRAFTAGSQIFFLWKDGSTSLEKLSDLKEYYPVKVAEISVAQEINHVSAFDLWIKHVLNKNGKTGALVK